MNLAQTFVKKKSAARLHNRAIAQSRAWASLMVIHASTQSSVGAALRWASKRHLRTARRWEHCLRSGARSRCVHERRTRVAVGGFIGFEFAKPKSASWLRRLPARLK